jgi:hypothetical protein
VIGIELASELRDAGLDWRPRPGDRFAIPDRGLDDQTFVLSDMIAQVHELPVGTVIGFNGTTEWALDDVERDEAIWLPREDQLRELLGGTFRLLRRTDTGYQVEVHLLGGTRSFVAGTPEEAYAAALLDLLSAAGA